MANNNPFGIKVVVVGEGAPAEPGGTSLPNNGVNGELLRFVGLDANNEATVVWTSDYVSQNALANLGFDIIPAANGLYTLGNSTNQWAELYVSGNTLYINNVPISVTNTGGLSYGDQYFVLSNTPGDVNLSDYSNTAQMLAADAVTYANAVAAANTMDAVVLANAYSYANLVAESARADAVGSALIFANNAYNNAVAEAGVLANAAYANASGLATTLADQAYTNAVADSGAGDAYANAVAYANDVYANAIAFATTRSDAAYANAYGLIVSLSDIAYSNAANLAVSLSSAAYANAVADTNTAIVTGVTQAYTNAVSQAIILAGAAYNNAISFSGNSVEAYVNAIAYSGNSVEAYANAIAFAQAAADQAFANAIASSNDVVYAQQAYINAVAYTDNRIATVNSDIIATSDQAYSNAIAVSALQAANAFANAIAYSGNAAQAFTNAVAQASSLADAAYANAYGYATSIAYTAYTNAVVESAAAYTNSVAYTDGVSNTLQGYIAANSTAAYANAVNYAISVGTTAYSNAISEAATLADTAYSNAVLVAQTQGAAAYANAYGAAVSLSDTAYTNAVSDSANIANSIATSYYNMAVGAAALLAANAYSNAVAHEEAHIANLFATSNGITFSYDGTQWSANVTATSNGATSNGANVWFNIVYANVVRGYDNLLIGDPAWVPNTTFAANVTTFTGKKYDINLIDSFTLLGNSTYVSTQSVYIQSGTGSTTIAGNQSLTLGGTGGSARFQNVNISSGSLYIDNSESFVNSQFINFNANTRFLANGSYGGSGDVLSSSSAAGGIYWTRDITVNSVTTNVISINGSPGVPGQVLLSNGSVGSYWGPVPGGGGSNVDLANVSSNIIPSANLTYDIGTANNYWRNAYSNVIYSAIIRGAGIGTLTVGNTNNGQTLVGFGTNTTVYIGDIVGNGTRGSVGLAGGNVFIISSNATVNNAKIMTANTLANSTTVGVVSVDGTTIIANSTGGISANLSGSSFTNGSSIAVSNIVANSVYVYAPDDANTSANALFIGNVTNYPFPSGLGNISSTGGLVKFGTTSANSLTLIEGGSITIANYGDRNLQFLNGFASYNGPVQFWKLTAGSAQSFQIVNYDVTIPTSAQSGGLNGLSTVWANNYVQIGDTNGGSVNIPSANLTLGTANTSNVFINGKLSINANGTTGSAGQVLTSNGTTAFWAPASFDVANITSWQATTGSIGRVGMVQDGAIEAPIYWKPTANAWVYFANGSSI